MFPKIGVLPIHPLLDGIFPCKPSIWGYPPLLENPHVENPETMDRPDKYQDVFSAH